MNKMYHGNTMTAVLLLVLGSLLACGGGSGGPDVVIGGDGGSTTLVPSFTADQPDPDPNMVTLASQVVLGDELTVGVAVTDVTGIASVSLELTYDPTQVEFVEWSCGELFPPCGGSTLALFNNDTPGRLVFGLALPFAGSGVDAFNTETLLRVTFRAVGEGASRLDFDAAMSGLVDPDLQDISGITWHGGTVVVN